MSLRRRRQRKEANVAPPPSVTSDVPASYNSPELNLVSMTRTQVIQDPTYLMLKKMDQSSLAATLQGWKDNAYSPFVGYTVHTQTITDIGAPTIPAGAILMGGVSDGPPLAGVITQTVYYFS